jgi:hypothetical protein
MSGRIRSIEKSSGLIGNQTCDLLACSIVPQQTMLLCIPVEFNNKAILCHFINQ